ncbi:hypothetical protein B484DRAFT_391853 [Ochromonadaceae sp. CCMP2298]|nr:hypothetical protein B484DRAFT_391853 [Ochromonadaceae sp. CCMP2298]
MTRCCWRTFCVAKRPLALASSLPRTGGAAEGAVEGAVGGAVEGAVEGVVEGAVAGAVEGAVVEAAVEGAVESAVEGAVMKNVAFALLSLVLCWPSLTEAEKAAEDAEMPRAIIHIGPHKTATTSLQAMLTTANSIANMQAENTYWVKQAEVKHFSLDLSQVSPDSDAVAQIQKMGRFFNESLELSRNVVLSTESFVWMIPQKIQQLKDMLQGFDVTIVAVYREYLSHMLSFHAEQNKVFTGKFTPLSKYLLERMDYAQTESGRDYVTLLGHWRQVFGKDALKIVDYYGAIAAGKSVPHVVLCEVGGVLCGMEEAAHATHTNVSPGSLAEQQLFTHFLQFIGTQGTLVQCQPPPADYFVHTDLVNLFLKECEKKPGTPTLFILASNLTALVEHSVAWDTTIRDIFGDMVYANASANLQSALSAHVQEVDFDKLLLRNDWRVWMRGLYDKAVDRKLLCDSQK